MALSETLKIVLGTPVILIALLSFFARRHPHVRWLQPFNLQDRLTPEQRQRLRTTQERAAGAELMLLGIIIPMGYLAVKIMFFNAIEPRELLVIGLLSAVCFALGIIALVRAGK